VRYRRSCVLRTPAYSILLSHLRVASSSLLILRHGARTVQGQVGLVSSSEHGGYGPSFYFGFSLGSLFFVLVSRFSFLVLHSQHSPRRSKARALSRGTFSSFHGDKALCRPGWDGRRESFKTKRDASRKKTEEAKRKNKNKVSFLNLHHNHRRSSKPSFTNGKSTRLGDEQMMHDAKMVQPGPKEAFAFHTPISSTSSFVPPMLGLPYSAHAPRNVAVKASSVPF
jgi:hypothetical protein